MTEITVKEKQVEQNKSPQTEGRFTEVYKISGIKARETNSSNWTIALRAYQKYKSAGMDREDIRQALEKLGYQVEEFEGVLPVKRNPQMEGELGVSQNIMIDYHYKGYSPDQLLGNPQALQNFEKLTLSKSLALSQGVNGLVSVRGITRLVQELEIMEVNILIGESDSQIEC